ncbi:hypothetical protein QUB69_15185 [Microcoleus sp. AT13-A6]
MSYVLRNLRSSCSNAETISPIATAANSASGSPIALYSQWPTCLFGEKPYTLSC